MTSFIKSVWRYSVVTSLLIFFTSLPASAEPLKNIDIPYADLTSLDSRLQQFSSQFYTKIVRFENVKKIVSIDLLAQTVERYRSQDQLINANIAIINNLELVERNIDTTPIIKISELLIETNEWNTASQLYKKIKKQGDKSLVSNVSFSMAKYYFSRNQWKETISIVEAIRSDLPPEDYHHALLMQGISLQRLQKHRLALGQYAKIPPTSRYYAAARLNMAIANIRQDWWTDAHIIINDLLNDKNHNRDEEQTDRLYTVLGYSLLQQQYFRNSRDAFRNVSLDGKYTNKALLGIALTAAYQEDYPGALNATKILMNKKRHDLPVDEANLLVPYFYERLQQRTTASAGYLQAIKYYEIRTQSLQDALSNDSDSLRKQVVDTRSSAVELNNERLELNEQLPKFILDNIRMLALFQPYVARAGDAALVREFDALNTAYKNILQKAAQNILNEMLSHLTHYMNQSRYGLARMQDHDATTAQ